MITKKRTMLAGRKEVVTGRSPEVWLRCWCGCHFRADEATRPVLGRPLQRMELVGGDLCEAKSGWWLCREKSSSSKEQGQTRRDQIASILISN